MKIVGLENLTVSELNDELKKGAQFICYQYCISVGIMTMRRSSRTFFIKGDSNKIVKGLRYSLLTFLVGWWGIPWGPIYTVQSIWINFKGGHDITGEVLRAFAESQDKTNHQSNPT